jgi:hypothetical protein
LGLLASIALFAYVGPGNVLDSWGPVFDAVTGPIIGWIGHLLLSPLDLLGLTDEVINDLFYWMFLALSLVTLILNLYYVIHFSQRFVAGGVTPPQKKRKWLKIFLLSNIIALPVLPFLASFITGPAEGFGALALIALMVVLDLLYLSSTLVLSGVFATEQTKEKMAGKWLPLFAMLQVVVIVISQIS